MGADTGSNGGRQVSSASEQATRGALKRIQLCPVYTSLLRVALLATRHLLTLLLHLPRPAK